jgi:hypothetical protein
MTSVRFHLCNDLGTAGRIGNDDFEDGEITDFYVLRAQEVAPTYYLTFGQTRYRIT